MHKGIYTIRVGKKLSCFYCCLSRLRRFQIKRNFRHKKAEDHHYSTHGTVLMVSKQLFHLYDLLTDVALAMELYGLT